MTTHNRNDKATSTSESCLFLLRPFLKESPEPFLAEIEKERLREVEPVFRDVLQQDFDHQHFLEALCQQEEIGLELLWRLHQLGLLTLGGYLSSSQSSSAAAFSRSLITLCTQPPPDVQSASPLASGLLAYLVFYAFGDTSGEKSLVKTSMAIIETVVCRLIHFDEGNRERPLSLAETIYNCPLLDSSSLQRFSRHSLTLLLQHEPTIRVVRAVREQSRWGTSSLPAPTVAFLQQALSYLPPQTSTQLLFQLLEGTEVNWRHLLSSVSVLASLHGTDLLQELASKLLRQAFHNFQPDLLMGAFLLARQWSLTHSPSYQDWFKKNFGDSSLLHSSQTFKFLMAFLTQLVPAEPAQYLKAHIFSPPNIVTRPVYNEYLNLAKTRLSDLQEPLERMSLFNNNGDGKVQGDVDQALKLYAESGKLPNTILEASIFRKPYFIGHFLPALLTPSPITAVPDVKMRFIQELYKAKRIPTRLYDTFQENCSKATTRLVEEMGCDMDDGQDILEPEEEVLRLQEKLVAALSVAENSDCEEVQQLVAQVASALGQLPSKEAALLFCQLWCSLSQCRGWESRLVEALPQSLVRGLCSHLLASIQVPGREDLAHLLLKLCQLWAAPLSTWVFDALPVSPHFMKVASHYLSLVGELAPTSSLLPPSLTDKFQFACLRTGQPHNLPSSLACFIQHGRQLSFQRWLELESDTLIDEPCNPKERLAYLRRVTSHWNRSTVARQTLLFLLESSRPIQPSLISLLNQWPEKLPQGLLQEQLEAILTHAPASHLSSRLHHFFRVVWQLPPHLLFGLQGSPEYGCSLVCKLHPLVEDLTLPQHVTACLLLCLQASYPARWCSLLDRCPLMALSAVTHLCSLPSPLQPHITEKLGESLQWAVQLAQSSPESRLWQLVARQAFCTEDPPPAVVQEVSALVSGGVVAALVPSECPRLSKLLPPHVWRPGYPLACLRLLLRCRSASLDPAVWLDLALRNLTLCSRYSTQVGPLTSQLCQIAAAVPCSLLRKISKEVMDECPAPVQLVTSSRLKEALTPQAGD